MESAEKSVPMQTRQYVRSLMFSVKISSPLARLHVVTKLLAVLAVSLIAVRAMRSENPDPAAALVICLFVTRLERWLSRAAAIARRLRRWFAAAPRAAAGRRPLEADTLRPLRARRAGPSLSRGPPALRPA